MISLFQKNLHLTLLSGSFFSSKIFLFQPDIYLFQQDIFRVYKPSSATRGTQSPPEGNFPGTKNQEQGRLEVPHSDYSWVSFFVPTPTKFLDQICLKSKAEKSMGKHIVGGGTPHILCWWGNNRVGDTTQNWENQSKYTAGWLAGWLKSDYSTNLWLHLASWNLPDSQLSWVSKMEPSVAISKELRISQISKKKWYVKFYSILSVFCYSIK